MIYIKNTEQVPVGAKNWLQWKALFQCELCGNVVEVLKSNGIKQKSCGCHKGTHGMAYSRIYKIWEDMKKRCDNSSTKAYKHYGAKGITYTEAWKDFKNFYEDMHTTYEEHLTLDRIDPKGNYTKSNCQWLTKSENAGKDSRGCKQSPEWVQKRTQNQIKVNESLLQEILEKQKQGTSIKQLCEDYNISRDAIKNAKKRYAND